jgi:hypothetical protein
LIPFWGNAKKNGIVKLLLVEASETCTKRQDFTSYGGVENREGDNLRGFDTDSLPV